MQDYGTTNNTPAHQAPPVWRAPEGLEDLTAAQVGGGGSCQHTNDKPDRSGAPRGLRGLAAVPVGDGGAAPLVWRTPEGPAAVLVGGGRAWPGFEIDHSERSSRVAISRAGRCPPAHTAARPNKTGHAAAGPGRASRRHAEPIISTPGSTGVEDTGGLAAVPVGGGGAAPLVWRTPEGPAAVPVGGGRSWPGFEIDHSERSSRVAISRAGRRPPAPTRRHKHSATNA